MPNHFCLKLLLCLFHAAIIIDVIYKFNTYEMLQAVIKTIRKWMRIQCQIFIRCIVASLILYNSKIIHLAK